jgi:hypothetical protein
MPTPMPHDTDLPLHTPSLASTAMATAIALLAWSSLALQTDLTVHRLLLRGFDMAEALGRVAGYLTNLTALAVALCFTCVALRVRAAPGRFLRQPAAVTAVVVYIVFVGIAYNVLLRHLWTPHGWRAWLNESMHTVSPLLCALYWLLFVPRFRLTVRACLLWFVYPLTYLLVTFWRGSTSDFYPYPFIDVSRLGYPRVMFNTAMLLVCLVVLMALFAAINARRAPVRP